MFDANNTTLEPTNSTTLFESSVKDMNSTILYPESEGGSLNRFSQELKQLTEAIQKLKIELQQEMDNIKREQ